MKHFFIAIIRAYQVSLSPDHGLMRPRYPYGFCRHYPSCSQYALEAVERFGSMKGLGLAACRVLRCVPWAESRIDRVPQA